MNWNDITLEKFKKIQEILEVQDDYTTFNLLDIVYDISSCDMTLNEISSYSNALDFMSKEIPHVKLQDYYTINKTIYKFNKELSKVTAAQYIDYTNYMKEDKIKYEDVLSVLFIPEGHKYNDGYDLEQVKKDILQLPITVVYTAAFFLTKQFQIFLHYFQRYLIQSLKKMKNKENTQKLIKILKEMDFPSMVCYPIY